MTPAGTPSLSSSTLLSMGLHVTIYALATWCWAGASTRPAPGLGTQDLAQARVSVHTVFEEPVSEETVEEVEPVEASEPEPLPPPPFETSEHAVQAEALPELALTPEAESLEASEPALEPLLPPLETPRELVGRRVRPLAVAVAPAPAPAVPPTSAPARGGAALIARSAPTPNLPAGLTLSGETRVGLLFYVREDGSLADVRVEAPSGVPTLDEHVRTFVLRRWSFAPLSEPRWVRQSFRVGA